MPDSLSCVMIDMLQALSKHAALALHIVAPVPSDEYKCFPHTAHAVHHCCAFMHR